jgi:hypothetical protein
MNRDIWGVFHDGVVKLIEGTVPGTLKLEIEIDYLRRMFPEPGDRFVVMLFGCSKFTYADYDEPPTEDIAHIQCREPEILYITSEQPVVLDCAKGTLEFEYDEMTVSLESGRAVGYESLASACRKYWTDWKSRTKTEG